MTVDQNFGITLIPHCSSVNNLRYGPSIALLAEHNNLLVKIGLAPIRHVVGCRAAKQCATEDHLKAHYKLAVAGASVVLIGLTIALSMRDSLRNAANRLGNSVLRRDIQTIWTFVSASDRKEYGLDQEKFTRFWTQIVVPRMKASSQFEITDANESGLDLTFFDSQRKGTFRLIVSGNEGEYYCPFIIANLCDSCAMIDMKPTSIIQARDNRHAFLAKWYRSNKEALQACGIGGVKTNIRDGFRSIDDVIRAYEFMAANPGIPPP